VAFDELELRVQLQHIDELSASVSIGAYAQPELITAIREFIHGTAFRSTSDRSLPDR
jgi:hypothetical protein